MGQPKVTVDFVEAARAVISRADRGIIGMIVNDTAVPAKNPTTIIGVSDIPSTLSATNKLLISNAREGYLNPANKILLFVCSPAGTDVYTEVTPNAGDNPATEGWYTEASGVYTPAADTHVVSGATYYTVVGTEVTPEGSENPSTEGWYEKDTDNVYSPSEDTSVGAKTYYSVAAAAVTNADPGDNPSAEGWYEDSASGKVLSADTYVVASKTYYEKSTTSGLDYGPALTYFETAGINWLIAPSAETDGKINDIVTWVKECRENNICIKAVLPNTAANHESIVNVTTEEATDGVNTYTTEQLCARVGGIIATTPLTGGNARSATYAPMPELTNCSKLSVVEMDQAADNGELIMFHDGEKVKLGRAVNSLKTTEKSDQWKKIRIVEIMDIIKTDIYRTAQDKFVGKYVASYDNKMLLVAAIKAYLGELARLKAIEEIEDSDVDLNVEAIKGYLASVGIDYTTMTDDEIKRANTGSHVYIVAYISILDAIEDIAIEINI